MARLFALAMVVAGAMAAGLVINGPGIDKPEEADAGAPERTSEQVSAIKPDGTVPLPAQEVPTGARGATVGMRRLRFVPERVTVREGEAVVWVNRDGVVHNVVEDVGPRSGIDPDFASENILPGGRFSYVTRSARTIDYVCTLHPTVMKGRIMVRPAQG